MLSSDSPVGIAKSMGLAMIGCAEAYERLRPHVIVVLGDRFEVFSAVAAALVAKIPVAHIHGGELTEGAFDDALRHSITKMSHLHFTSTSEYRRRVIQLGEQPDRVFHVGALGISVIAYKLAKSRRMNSKFSFGAGKFIPLGGYTSAIMLGFVAFLMGVESFQRFFDPHGISFNTAILIS